MARVQKRGKIMQLQENSSQESEALSLELLHKKSEKLRKALWGNHATVCNKMAFNEEKLDWIADRLARIECAIEGR
jgi:hypothetical protein